MKHFLMKSFMFGSFFEINLVFEPSSSNFRNSASNPNTNVHCSLKAEALIAPVASAILKLVVDFAIGIDPAHLRKQ